MWVLTIAIFVGFAATVFNLKGYCLFGKYEGAALTFVALVASVLTGVYTAKHNHIESFASLYM